MLACSGRVPGAVCPNGAGAAGVKGRWFKASGLSGDVGSVLGGTAEIGRCSCVAAGREKGEGWAVSLMPDNGVAEPVGAFFSVSSVLLFSAL